MYIGTNPFYYSGILSGIKNRTWGKFISLNFVYENQQISKRPYMSEVGIFYIKRKQDEYRR